MTWRIERRKQRRKKNDSISIVKVRSLKNTKKKMLRWIHKIMLIRCVRHRYVDEDVHSDVHLATSCANDVQNHSKKKRVSFHIYYLVYSYWNRVIPCLHPIGFTHSGNGMQWIDEKCMQFLKCVSSFQNYDEMRHEQTEYAKHICGQVCCHTEYTETKKPLE